jgi:hypothetical protein
MVYSFGPADEKLGYTYGHDILDKDLELSISGSLKVAVIDQTDDRGTGFDDPVNKGRAVSVDYFPKKIRKQGPRRRIPDMERVGGFIVVSQKYKDLVDNFEPGVHQFSPVEVYWDKNEPPVGTYYFFNICNRLDTTDKVKSTQTWHSTAVASFWRYGKLGETLIFRKGSYGKAVLWADKHILASPPLCTDAFHDATIEAGCDGIDYIRFDEV